MLDDASVPSWHPKFLLSYVGFSVKLRDLRHMHFLEFYPVLEMQAFFQ